ncbi:MAG: VOC family protein, partial [bacterium]
MQLDNDVSRRVFLGTLGALAVAPRSFAQTGPPIPITSINHMTISVSDPARSLEWYQGLFGMPIAARQANTVILRLGDGPQFMAIGGGASENPGINHLCLSTPNFDDDRIVGILGEHGVRSAQTSGPMEVRVRMRGA